MRNDVAPPAPLLLDLDDAPGTRAPLPPHAAKVRPGRFEVGVVYRDGPRRFLALSERELLTFVEGQPRSVRPTTPLGVAQGLSTDALCRSWGISAARLDEVLRDRFTPAAHAVKPRTPGSRRARAAEDLAWRILRTARLTAA